MMACVQPKKGSNINSDNKNARMVTATAAVTGRGMLATGVNEQSQSSGCEHEQTDSSAGSDFVFTCMLMERETSIGWLQEGSVKGKIGIPLDAWEVVRV